VLARGPIRPANHPPSCPAGSALDNRCPPGARQVESAGRDRAATSPRFVCLVQLFSREHLMGTTLCAVLILLLALGSTGHAESKAADHVEAVRTILDALDARDAQVHSG